jgi:hypothetical protein
MSNSKTLDRLILADFLLAVVSLGWSALAPPPSPSQFAFVVWITVCSATVVSWVGLLYRIKPARTLYALSWLGYLALVALREGGAASPLSAVLDLATGLVGGMILALVYFSDLRGQLRSFGGACAEILPAR